VVVDEGQDLHVEEWKLIRAMVPEGPNDLFIVGDAHQRIYARKVVLGRCGINIRGRSSKLKINYRTTRQIKNWSVAMLEGVDYDDLDGGQDDQKGYISLFNGPKPEVHRFATLEEEQEFLGTTLRDLRGSTEYKPEDVCLVARTEKMLERDYVSMLKKAKIPYAILTKDDTATKEELRLANMHRVKGLEFRCMIIAGVSEDRIPLMIASLEDDETGKAEHEARERSLLFVSATRARDRLIVTCSGEPSRYLANSGVDSQ
jgi:superfamily I DNA/RNA helicase